MQQMIGVDGYLLEVRGYGAIWGACEHGERMCRRPFVTDGNVLLSVNHAADRVQLASVNDGSMRIWQDDTGLGFEADVPADALGLWTLQYLAATGRCSYLGKERHRECDDGVREIVGVTLQEISLTSSPFFSATGCWRSDVDWHDLPADTRRLYHQFDKGKREPLPDLLKITARQRPPAVAPAQVRASVRGSAPSKTALRCAASLDEWRELLGDPQLAAWAAELQTMRSR